MIYEASVIPPQITAYKAHAVGIAESVLKNWLGLGPKRTAKKLAKAAILGMLFLV